MKHFLFYDEFTEKLSSMHTDLHLRIRYSGHLTIKLEFSRLIFEKYSNIK